MGWAMHLQTNTFNFRFFSSQLCPSEAWRTSWRNLQRWRTELSQKFMLCQTKSNVLGVQNKMKKIHVTDRNFARSGDSATVRGWEHTSSMLTTATCSPAQYDAAKINPALGEQWQESSDRPELANNFVLAGNRSHCNKLTIGLQSRAPVAYASAISVPEKLLRERERENSFRSVLRRLENRRGEGDEDLGGRWWGKRAGTLKRPAFHGPGSCKPQCVSRQIFHSAVTHRPYSFRRWLL